MSLRRYRWPAILLLALHFQACSTWRPTALPLAEVIAADPGSIRITTMKGRTWTLDDPILVGDSVSTAEALAYCPRERREPCAATQVNGVPLTPTPLDDVVEVQVRRVSVGRTVLVVTLGVVGAVALIAAASGGSREGGDGWVLR